MERPPSKGVVLAAGSGVRLMPLTATRPKPMLPIAGKPLLEYNLDQLAAAGVREIIVLVPPNSEQVRQYFGPQFRGCDLIYAVQHEARGTGHALNAVRNAIGDEAFFCIFGDNLTTWPVAHLLRPHREVRAVATLALFHALDPRRHGVVELQGPTIRRIVEKPDHPPSDLASAGMFIFEPQIFEALSVIEPTSRGELELPNAIQHLITHHRTVAYEVLDEWRLNVNTPADMLEANHYLLCRNRPALSSPNVAPSVIAAGDLRIEPGGVVGPCVSCGRGCVIGAGARVTESILLDSVIIEADAEVWRSILGGSVRVKAGASVRDQVVADNGVCG